MKEYIHIMPKKMKNKKGIYEFISVLYNTFKNKSHSKISLDFKSTTYIDPAIIAPLGLILTRIKSNKNNIYFKNLSNFNIKYLNKFGLIEIDNKNSFNINNTIKYKTFDDNDFENFKKYLLNQLNELKDRELIETLIIYLGELFENVRMHSNSNKRYKNKKIFISGYYNIENDFVRFCITNNGCSFKENILNKLHINYHNEFEYILWALKRSNSTRDSDTPGGLGLNMLNNLIENTNGDLIIISGKGYIEITDFKQNSLDLNCHYPGSIISFTVQIKKMKASISQNNYINSEAILISDLIEEDI